MKNRIFPLRWLMVLMMVLNVPVPAMAQSNFPFNEIQELTPEQVKIQKYKLQRLRVQLLRDDWYIIRGINERIDDMTLLKMSGRTLKVQDQQAKQAMGHYIAIGGLVVTGAGALILSDLIKFSNSTLVGIGLVILGGAAAVGGEFWAGDLSEENPHVLDRPEAEEMATEYNLKLKTELGLLNVPNLD